MNGGEVYWKWAVRILGLAGFTTLLVLFALGREVPTAFLVLIGGMIGLEPIINWHRKAEIEPSFSWKAKEPTNERDE